MSERTADTYSLRVAALGLVLAVGIHIDGWAHNHGRVDDSFFTVWHALFYGAFAVVVVAVLAPVLRARARGAAWRDAIRPGYGATLTGIVVFFLGGFGDMLWHIAFGVEGGVEALLSPTHMLLAAGGVLMAAGPFIAGTRHGGRGWRGTAPAVLTSLAFLSFIGFMTQYMHPWSELWPTTEWQSGVGAPQLTAALGAAGYLWYGASLTAVVLVLRRFDALPTGAVGLLIAGSAAFAVTQGDHYWLALPAVLAGAAVEAVCRWIPDTRVGLRVLAFVVPAVPVSVHLVMLALAFDIAWTVHLWAGTPVMTGLTGALVSLVVLPPASPGT